MSTYYRDIQIIKHALQFYIKRSDANEKDLEKEKKLLKKVENEVKEELTTIKDAISKLNSKATEKNITGLIALANDGAFSVYGAESRFGIIHNNFGITPVDKNI